MKVLQLMMVGALICVVVALIIVVTSNGIWAIVPLIITLGLLIYVDIALAVIHRNNRGIGGS